MTDSKEWRDIITKHPESIKGCQWEDMNNGDWINVLITYPQFHDRIHWNEFDQQNLVGLCFYHPHFKYRTLGTQIIHIPWVFRYVPMFMRTRFMTATTYKDII